MSKIQKETDRKKNLDLLRFKIEYGIWSGEEKRKRERYF